MRRLLALLCFLFLAVCISGCDKAAELAGKTYRYEKEGFGSEFTITLNEDGTMSYYEGMLSSYTAQGTWSLEGNYVTIIDLSSGEGRMNRFRVENCTLVFVDEGSENFTFVDVTAGERFLPDEG